MDAFYHLLYSSLFIQMVLNNLPLSASDKNLKCQDAKVHASNTSIIFTILRIIKLLKYDMASFNSGFLKSSEFWLHNYTAISCNGMSETLIYIKMHYDKMRTISIEININIYTHYTAWMNLVLIFFEKSVISKMVLKLKGIYAWTWIERFGR